VAALKKKHAADETPEEKHRQALAELAEFLETSERKIVGVETARGAVIAESHRVEEAEKAIEKAREAELEGRRQAAEAGREYKQTKTIEKAERHLAAAKLSLEAARTVYRELRQHSAMFDQALAVRQGHVDYTMILRVINDPKVRSAVKAFIKAHKAYLRQAASMVYLLDNAIEAGSDHELKMALQGALNVPVRRQIGAFTPSPAEKYMRALAKDPDAEFEEI
jgi:hypothetical protein